MIRSPKFCEPALVGGLHGRLRSNSIRFLPRTPIWPLRTAASASFATDMIRFARSRPGSARSKCKSRRPAIVVRRRLASAFASRLRSYQNGRGERRASMRSCQLSICAGFRRAIFRRFSRPCSAKDPPNLSPAVIARLKGEWEDEYQQWQKRALSARRYVYAWAEGGHQGEGQTTRR